MGFGIGLLLFGLLIIAWGIFTIKKPDFGWRMNEGWKVKGDSEPSDSYLDTVKLGGVACILVGSLLLIGGILNLL